MYFPATHLHTYMIKLYILIILKPIYLVLNLFCIDKISKRNLLKII